MPTANTKITLPPPPRHWIQANKRIVECTHAPTQTLPPDSVGPVRFKSEVNESVTITVTEVLVNGKTSKPCTITFTPHSAVVPSAADPSGFVVEIESMEDDSASGSQAESGSGSQIESASGPQSESASASQSESASGSQEANVTVTLPETAQPTQSAPSPNVSVTLEPTSPPQQTAPSPQAHPQRKV